MDVDRYKNIYEGFFMKNPTYQMSMRGRMTIIQAVHASLEKNSLIYSLSLLVKSFEDET